LIAVVGGCVSANDGFRDLATVLALNGDYATAEKFFPCEYGIRVQKIGTSYRVLKKIFTGGRSVRQSSLCVPTILLCLSVACRRRLEVAVRRRGFARDSADAQVQTVGGRSGEVLWR
jgi:hypothetical protein